jgi:hypothetical protein
MTFLTASSVRTRASALPRLPLALALTFGLAALGWQAPASASTDKAAATAASSQSKPSASASTGSGAEAVLIKALNPGDTACYITLENARGKRSEEMASFELCERPKLVGQRVLLKRKAEKVMAASCQGNMDCKKTQTVNLIVGVEKAP